MKKVLLILLIGIIIVFPALYIIEAQVTEGPDVVLPDMEAVEGLLNTVIRWMWAIAAFVVVIFFLYAGFLFVTAGGNDDQINKAKGIVKWGLIGVVVMILAGSVMAVMQSFLQP